MTMPSETVTHQMPDAILAAYAAGNLEWHYALVVASQASMCDETRARLAAHEAVGGVVLETTTDQSLSADLKSNVLARLDDQVEETPVYQRHDVLPAPVMAALSGKAPKWKSLGFGVKQSIIHSDKSGSVRLLHIPAGEAVPEHGHEGIEMTLVLQGAFHDETGYFGVGDVEVADDSLDHQPIAAEGQPCICLAATGAPLKFHSWVTRLFQPIFRI